MQISLQEHLKSLPISLSLLGKTISSVSFAKDLGVYVDQYLTYDVHTTKTASRKHFYYLNSFVFSKLFYCSSVWGNIIYTNYSWYKILLPELC